MTNATWEILESVTEKASGKRVNEDRVGVEGRLAWVIDGATGLSDYPVTPEESDANWLVEIVVEVIRDSAADPALDPRSIIRRAIETAVDRAKTEWNAVPEFPPSAAICLLAADSDGVDYAILADVTLVLADGRSISDHRVDLSNAPAMTKLVELLDAGASFEDARAQINDLLVAARVNGMNRENGYWVLADALEAADHAETGRLSLDECQKLVLTSDGFSRAVDLFPLEADWSRLLSGERPLADVLAEVRELESREDSLTQFPRWSRSDDATAARVSLAWEQTPRMS